MDAKEIANKLVEHCRNHTEAQALDELYAPDAVSSEAFAGPDMPREVTGIEAIKGKHDWWNSNFEVHDGSTSDPMMHGDDSFAVIFEMDATHKQSGERSKMKEIAVYHVDSGKIVKEQFFYTM
ncbi:nuclear transport factor 2 family protein [Pontivivens ytuae]|uniref:Nuclear transport factor 2 family protein n=1 Tax=Pontivivens ytuae TaxID=2789856 RepID=A0A7S9QDS9_9RHOB|nr:nuclear transport factor 2 family protein [Pontivivens ytuae]QPH54697.1 nuclear transport factor 2 family protein [Pontivivens ytuae]